MSLLINTFEGIEASELAKIQRELSRPAFPVGPLHLLSQAPAEQSLHAPDRGCLAWLDALRALREPGQRGLRRPRRRLRGDGVGVGPQRRAVPVSCPSGLGRRRRGGSAIARWVQRGDQEQEQREDCHLGATERGLGARRHWCVLDALRMELGLGERLRRRAHACAAVLRGPDGERENRDTSRMSGALGWRLGKRFRGGGLPRW